MSMSSATNLSDVDGSNEAKMAVMMNLPLVEKPLLLFLSPGVHSLPNGPEAATRGEKDIIRHFVI